MARRRMIAGRIIGQDAFLEMSSGAQALYYQLIVEADDDGFVANPKKITRGVGRTASELEELIDSGYVLRFGSGVVVITHWNAQNEIKKDRYNSTVYKAEYEQLCLDSEQAYQFKKDTVSSMDTDCIQTGYSTDTDCIHNINKDNISQKVSQNKISQDNTNQEK